MYVYLYVYIYIYIYIYIYTQRYVTGSNEMSHMSTTKLNLFSHIIGKNMY